MSMKVPGHISRVSNCQSTKKSDPAGRYSKHDKAPVDLVSKFVHKAGNDQKERTEIAKARLLEKLIKRRAAEERAADFDARLRRIIES